MKIPIDLITSAIALVLSFSSAWDHNWSAMLGWFLGSVGAARAAGSKP